MPYLAAAVLVAALLALLALALSLRLARAVRELRARLEAVAGGSDAAPARSASPMFPVGIPVRPFSVPAEDGSTLTEADLTLGTLVAVLSPHCGPCRERLPALVAAAEQLPGAPGRVVVAVVDAPDGAPAYSAALGSLARVVSGTGGEVLAEALSVGQYPFFVWMGSGGTIELGGLGIDLEAMPAGSRA